MTLGMHSRPDVDETTAAPRHSLSKTLTQWWKSGWLFFKERMKLKLKQKEDLKAEHRRTTVPGSDWSGVGLGSPPQRWSATTVPRRPDVHPSKPEERLTRCRLIGGTSCPSSLVSSGSTPRWWRGFQVLFADTHTRTHTVNSTVSAVDVSVSVVVCAVNSRHVSSSSDLNQMTYTALKELAGFENIPTHLKKASTTRPSYWICIRPNPDIWWTFVSHCAVCCLLLLKGYLPHQESLCLCVWLNLAATSRCEETCRWIFVSLWCLLPERLHTLHFITQTLHDASIRHFSLHCVCVCVFVWISAVCPITWG